MKLVNYILLSFFLSLAYIGNAQWVQIGNSIEGEEINDCLGHSISLNADGSIIAVASKHCYAESNSAGYVKIFENISGNWQQIGQTLEGDNIDDRFGTCISLNDDGSIIAIGALGNSENGEASGQLKVFENISGTWQQIGQDIYGDEAGYWLGFYVKINSSGNTIAVSSPYYDTGRVRIFKNISGNWQQIGQDINGEHVYDETGSSISLSDDGSIIAIGAKYNDDNGYSSGYVRVFKNIGNNWVQLGQNINGGSSGYKFGASVDLSASGSTLVIGAPGIGHTKVYGITGNQWFQIGNTIVSEQVGDQNGAFVQINDAGSIIAVSATNSDGSNGENTGQVRLYQNNSGVWQKIGEDIEGNFASDFSGKGLSLNATGDIIAIGSSYNNDNGENSGHVRIFTYECDAINNYNYEGDSIICDNTPIELDAGQGAQYIWSTGDQTRYITVQDSGYYYVTVSAFDCSSVDSIHVSNGGSFANTPVFLNPNTSLCANDEATYIAVYDENVDSYHWIIPPSWTGNSNTNELQVICNNESGYIKVFAENACGISDADSIFIDVADDVALQPSVIYGPNPVCANSNAIYSVNHIQNTTYYWDLPAGWSGSGNNSSINVNTGSNGGLITLVPFNACGMGISRNLNVTVENNLPVANFNYIEDATEIAFINSSENATSYFWEFGDGLNSSLENPIHNYTNPGEYHIILTAYNACGEDSKESDINVLNLNTIDNQNISFSVFPNPTKGKVHIKGEKIKKICVTDITGQVILRENVTNNNAIIDLSHALKGIYLVSISTKKEKFTKKIIVL